MIVEKTKMMVSGTVGEITSSKIDPCGVCGKGLGLALCVAHSV